MGFCVALKHGKYGFLTGRSIGRITLQIDGDDEMMRGAKIRRLPPHVANAANTSGWICGAPWRYEVLSDPGDKSCKAEKSAMPGTAIWATINCQGSLPG